MSIDPHQEPPPKRSSRRRRGVLHRLAGWLLTVPRAPPPEIQNELVRQSLVKPKTLFAAVVGSAILAAVAALMFKALWTELWLLAQIVAGCVRLLVMRAFIKAEASGQSGNILASVSSGLLVFCVIAAGGYHCVLSGEWLLISMAGISIATLMGGVASRDAGTPRYGTLIICIMALPFAFAALRSPVPYLFILGIQVPLYALAVIFVMLENHRVLIDLYYSERENHLLAQHDRLTGLPNRAFNLIRLDQLLRGLRSADGKLGQEFMVFGLDLDGFKDINDSFGHAAGDAVLIEVTKRLRENVRSLDFISRVGGDEFVVLLPDISPHDAAKIAERIIASIAAPFDLDLPTPVNIGISIGSASAPDDGETADELMRAADHALYEAKRRGKGIFLSHSTLKVTLVPSANADAQMAGFGMPENRSNGSPLPTRAAPSSNRSTAKSL